MEEPLQVFCCYARKDYSQLNKLKTHLKVLEHDHLIMVRADMDINAGKEWEKEIKTSLETAQIILLLISPNFMASEYCYSREMKRAIERHEQGEARVIPLLLRSVEWQSTPLGKLQALPPNAKPIAKWRPQDDGFVTIAQGIRKVAEELRDLRKPEIAPKTPWDGLGVPTSIPPLVPTLAFKLQPPVVAQQIPISGDLLALLNQYKERCQRRNTPFLTPHLLLALFETHSGKARYHLDLLISPRAAEVLSYLKNYVDVILPTAGMSFSDFQWEERKDVQNAQQLAWEYRSNEVTEEHLLLGALDTKSTSATIQALKGLLGEDDFHMLTMNIKRSLRPVSRYPTTPMIVPPPMKPFS